jgi:hypothetical protein
MQCSDCRKWLTQRVTDYEDGSRVVNFQAPDGKGQCEVLKIDTPAAFGCNQFEAGHDHIEIIGKKTGSPWHHSRRIACPNCAGSGVIGMDSCDKCQRGGFVSIYDDGYIAEEKTRRHPNEIVNGPPPPPQCPSCSNKIEISWKACPFCGMRFPDPTSVRISEIL